MKTVIISQARMTSKRLPGKVLKEVMGKPLLEYHIERLKKVKLADEVVVATTTNKEDDAIVNLCKKISTAYYRGPEDDVLLRYYEAAKKYYADIIVRVTSDCPLIDPKVIDKVIKFYIDNKEKYDYVSNTLQRTYPRGMDTSVFPYWVLSEACKDSMTPSDREHVTLFIYRQPERYRLGNVSYKEDQSYHRWTVDTIEDFELIKKIINSLYLGNECFSMEECLNFLHNNKDLLNINSFIQQKNS